MQPSRRHVNAFVGGSYFGARASFMSAYKPAPFTLFNLTNEHSRRNIVPARTVTNAEGDYERATG